MFSIHSQFSFPQSLTAAGELVVAKRFGHVTAVERVSLAVAHGSILGFLSPNGSAKTTVIRTLCGLIAPTSGRARIAGFDVERETDRIKGILGYLSQKFSLYGG